MRFAAMTVFVHACGSYQQVNDRISGSSCFTALPSSLHISHTLALRPALQDSGTVARSDAAVFQTIAVGMHSLAESLARPEGGLSNAMLSSNVRMWSSHISDSDATELMPDDVLLHTL